MGVANPHRGEVDVELAGKDYKLRYGHNALAEVEKELKRPITAIFAVDENGEVTNFGFVEILALLAAGLRHQVKRMTSQRVGDLLDKSDRPLTYYGEKIGEALRTVLGKKDEDEDEDEDEAEGEDSSEGEGDGKVRPLTGTDS
jgi:hypothetical protein